MDERDLLFVLGLGRSGTSVLTDLVNAHPRIAVGMERYKALYPLDRPLVTHDLFDRERFFDFSDGLTNVRPEGNPRWTAFYDALAAKWETAAYVGDKLTGARIQHIWKAAPEARFLCIVRDIDQVAASWDTRARNDQDVNWSANADARQAVEKWNLTLRRIRRAAKQRPDLITVVEYERLYGDPAGAAMGLFLARLGLQRDEAMDQMFAKVHAKYVDTVAPKERTLAPDVVAHLDQTADRDVWHDLRELAV